ncbi:MAG: copper chaperone PCu(A)C [Pseudobdellovibrio sp.]
MNKLFVIFAAFLICLTVQAKKSKAVIEMADSRIFAPLKGSNATAGYASIKNISKKTVVISILHAESFKAAELHETIEKDNRMSMQKVDQLVIRSGQGIELKPGGNHIMLFDSNRELNPGDVLKVSFIVNGKPQDFLFDVISRVTRKGDIKTH